jgi:hypothetical protein
VHVSQGVLVLVFVQKLLTLTIAIGLRQIHEANLALQLIVEGFQVPVFLGLV